MFGVLTMMMMNASTSSYRSIYNARQEDAESNGLRFLRRHLAKFIVSLIVFVLVFTSFLIIGTKASGTVVDEPSINETVVMVGSGDTLWSIASRHKDGNDIGYLVFAIKDRNGLDSVDLQPGQKLIIPEI